MTGNQQPTESAATIRGRRYSTDPEWFTDFRTFPIHGLGPEEGVHRRDPSSVLTVDGVYHVWYTRSTGVTDGFGTGDPMAKVFPWDWSEVWHATSTDGATWVEQGRALGKGEDGSYDDRSVFTPEVLEHDGAFYLVYQVIASPYLLRSFESIAIAKASSPDGPWEKSAAPILEPQKDGEWLGGGDNRLAVVSQGSFDSHKVHDPILVPYQGKFFLYYKGEQMGEGFAAGGRTTRWGVAIADDIQGPYVRSPLNPVTNSGHETCVWRYDGGIAAMLTTDGPERNTLQFAPDGLNFEIQAYIQKPPVAVGPLRLDGPAEVPLDGIRWGLCHDVTGPWNYIQGFAADERQKELYVSGQSPETSEATVSALPAPRPR
ncbi:glycosyhydrolase [Paraoerskovia sediminicola]|uniref:Glycosyhydrolase n=1 Tax=Paraoerskovia sediminicola TaxID=1138587 RepID=A0ABN6XAZ0_9CELL|nr:glycosyl hydrolase [Paraoerskovia sediminicola]BDZ41937.1 glycosyhydrolase [Paraoerskovia sediminicola]